MTNYIKYVIGFVGVLIVLTIFSGCRKDNELPMGGLAISLIGRSANCAWGDNLKREVISHVINKDTVSSDKLMPVKQTEAVNLKNYILSFNTYNVGFDVIGVDYKDYCELFNSEDYNPLFQAPYQCVFYEKGYYNENIQDMQIEKEIKKFLLRKYNSSISTIANIDSESGFNTRENLEIVDYRITPLIDMKITFSENLLGVNSGESLNELFMVYKYPSYHDFIINKDKVAVKGRVTDISITQYLSYAPLAPAQLFMRLKEGLKLTEALTGSFTIELTMDNNRKVTATTRRVTIVP